MKSPDLKADDHVKDTEVLKSHIVASAGWPGTWFDDPGTAGRAVGAEMAEPALKTIINLQGFVEQILRDEINFYLWNLHEIGGEDVVGANGEIDDYAITFSRPSARDVQKVGPALARLTQAIQTVTTGTKLLTPAESRAIIVSQINQLGLSDVPIEIELPAQLPSVIEDPAQLIGPGAGAVDKVDPTGAGNTAATNRKLDAQRAATAQQRAGITRTQEAIPLSIALFK
jgi:hypothetical protein